MDLVIKGLKNEAHARMFATWYCGQGEQDADIWFETNDLDTPYRDVKKATTKENGQLIVHVHYPSNDRET